ncbi:fimbria/pilus outer membrane usher protein [Enterobacteriaceae bacterium LUAb1]
MKCQIINYKILSVYRHSVILPFALTLIGTVFFNRSLAVEKNIEPPQNKEREEAVVVDFDPAFLHGSGIDVSRFSKMNPVLPGTHNVTVSVNEKRQGKLAVLFKQPQGQLSAEPCFTYQQLQTIGIRLDKKHENALSKNNEECQFITVWVDDSSSSYDSGNFDLSLNVPQFNVVTIPNGYINPGLWDSGETVGFVDYNGSFYSQFQGARKERSSSELYTGNIALATGVNFGEWRLRKRLNVNWNKGGGTKTQNLYGYVARDLTRLKGQLIVGEQNTNGDVFDSYSLRGVIVQSDERMLPDTMRNYTPVLRGVAETNAKVTVTQRGQIIYETVVPPGPFELNDIGTMGYGGDLIMTLTESDGRQKKELFPYSAPPMLLHEGVSRFSVSAGQLKDESISSRPKIVQANYHYGLLNAWTLYGGVQFADRYHAFAFGNAFNTPIGGISFDITHAKSIFNNRIYRSSEKRNASGNSYQVNFTKYLGSTDTNLTLAAYRYSSSGFYSFRDAALMRERGDDVMDNNYSIRSRHRFSATISQVLTDNISLYFNGSYYNYWGARKSSRQYSVSLNHALRNFNYSITASRVENKDRKNENSILVSVNVPLGMSKTINDKPVFTSIYSSVSHNNDNKTTFQTMATGSQGEQNELTYGVGISAARNGGESSSDGTINGNINYESGVGQFGISASANNHNAQQLGLTANGSLVAHKGGITAGPTIGSSPFAIIGAEGAEGARLMNGHGGKIDANGYAIMPSLQPYRENTVSLNISGLSSTVDVLENEKVVVPRSEAAIAVDMKTITGTPMILIVRDTQKNFLPIGTDLQDSHGVSQGIVGQGGMAFIRGWEPAKQNLYSIVDNQKLRCQLSADSLLKIKNSAHKDQIMQVEVVCSRN